MPRFVLLRHECPADYRDGPHWDLMLEHADQESEHRLATWSLRVLPTSWATALGVVDRGDEPTVEATLLPDHRAKYLDYEGPVTGNRGAVRRIAGGNIEWLEADESRVVTRLSETPLAGAVILDRLGGDRWRLSTG